MIDDEKQRLESNLDQLQQKLPGPLAGWVAWLRTNRARLIRIPVGLLLVLGGIFSIFPLLGIWMLPLGLMLLAIDVPFLRPLVNKAIAWGKSVWERWKQRRRR